MERRLSRDYRTVEDTITVKGACTGLDLRSGWRAVVHAVVKQMFSLFNWDIAPIVIDQRLDELEGRRAPR